MGNYIVTYQETLVYTFPYEATDGDDAITQFERDAKRGVVDFSDGYLVHSEIFAEEERN